MATPIPAELLAEAGSVLVVKPSSLGDIVHTLPAVAAVSRAHRHLEVRWVVNGGWETLLEGNRHLAEVITFPRNRMRGMAAVPRFLSWAKTFRGGARKRPEVVLDFQGLLRSALISRVRGAEATVGLSDAREGAGNFYRHVVGVDPGSHAVARYLRMAEALGVAVPGAEELEFDLPAGEAPSEGWGLAERFVLFHPYSRGAGKSLSAEVVGAFCERMAPMPVVVVGQRGGGGGVVDGKWGHVIDLTDRTTIPQLIGLMRRAAYAVSVDSGPMHLAAAIMGDRLLGIHTWTDPRKVGPYHAGSRVWKAGEIRGMGAWDDAEAARDEAPGTGAARDMADYVMSRVGAGGCFDRSR